MEGIATWLFALCCVGGLGNWIYSVYIQNQQENEQEDDE